MTNTVAPSIHILHSALVETLWQSTRWFSVGLSVGHKKPENVSLIKSLIIKRESINPSCTCLLTQITGVIPGPYIMLHILCRFFLVSEVCTNQNFITDNSNRTFTRASESKCQKSCIRILLSHSQVRFISYILMS